MQQKLQKKYISFESRKNVSPKLKEIRGTVTGYSFGKQGDPSALNAEANMTT